MHIWGCRSMEFSFISHSQLKKEETITGNTIWNNCDKQLKRLNKSRRQQHAANQGKLREIHFSNYCVWAWRWRLRGINPAIVPKALKDGSAYIVRRRHYHPPKGHELLTQGQRATLGKTVWGNTAVRIWKSRNFGFESREWRVRCIYRWSIRFIPLTSGGTVLENPTDPPLFKKFTASHETPKRHSPFSHSTNCLYPEISKYKSPGSPLLFLPDPF